MTYLAYMVFAALAALFLSMKTDRKFLSFALIFWMLAQPVINVKYIIPLPGLPFELQPNRVLFLLMLGYMLWSVVSGRKAPTGAKPPFEKYIHVYLGAVLLALIVNYAFVNPKNVIATPLEIVTFFTVYVVTKRYMTEKVFEAIIKAIVLMAVVGSVIAIMQMAVDSMFLRTGVTREAFGSKFRSTGIFESEYDFGYFQILAVIVSLLRYKGQLIRLFIVPLLAFSVLLTFHRLDWIILFICLVTYLALASKKKLSLPALSMAIFVPIILLASFEIYQTMGGRSAVIEERLKQDTVTGRFEQFAVVWDSILEHPMGVGSYDHPDYVSLMKRHGMVQWFKDRLGQPYTMPLAVHNGYLAAGIQYGILGMIAFTLLVFSMLRYFKKQINPNLRYSLIPFFTILIYAISNLSNSVSIFRAYFVVLMAILCGSLIALHRVEAQKQLAATGETALAVK